MRKSKTGLLRHLGWWLGLVPSGVAPADSLVLRRGCRVPADAAVQDEPTTRHILERLGYLDPVAPREPS